MNENIVLNAHVVTLLVVITAALAGGAVYQVLATASKTPPWLTWAGAIFTALLIYAFAPVLLLNR